MISIAFPVKFGMTVCMRKRYAIPAVIASLFPVSGWAQNASTAVTVVNPPAQLSRFVTAGSTNSNSIKATGGYVYSVTIAVTQATDPVFVHLYNKATAPTCGTDTPIWTGSAAAVTGGSATFSLGAEWGGAFPAGIGVCISKDYAGSTALTANDAVVSVGWR